MYFSSGSWSKEIALELKLMVGGISKLFISRPDQRAEVMLDSSVNFEHKKV